MHFLFQSLAMFVKNLSNGWGSDGIWDNNYNKQTEQLFKGHKELMIFCRWSAISVFQTFQMPISIDNECLLETF